MSSFLDLSGLTTFKKQCDSAYAPGLFKGYDVSSGKEGYVRLCTIKCTGAYQNSPFVFFISRRNDATFTKVSLCYDNCDKAANAVFKDAIADGPAQNAIWYVAEGESKYGIYARKSESYDNIGVFCPLQNTKYNPFSVTWDGTFASGLPTGSAKFSTNTLTAAQINSLF